MEVMALQGSVEYDTIWIAIVFVIVCCIGVFFAVFTMCFLRFRLRFKCSLFVVVLFSFMLFHMFH
jgi:hypothetical protein